MIEQKEIRMESKRRGCHLVTEEIVRQLGELPEKGLLNLFVMHTSCGLTINENFDPAVRSDMSRALDRIAPEGSGLYAHEDEGEDDMPAHVKSTLVGASLNIPISGHRLAMGTWQGIYLCEFRNHGGSRRIMATVIS